MHSRTNDFISLYNAFWYRDFPVVDGPIDFAKRADWTTHIASNIRQVAGLMGLFSCFETGGRTDAELQHADRKVWAKLEWEWDEPRDHKSGSGEIEKLASGSHKADQCIFIGYSQQRHLRQNLDLIHEAWEGIDKPLLVILVTFEQKGVWRYFKDLQTYTCDATGISLVREQPALPWEVPNSRWQSPYGSDSRT
ncbi:hypothetical protein F2S72_01485 [Pseudomonas syringae pv. actinidiae]|nr:hypothetical protein [Pseudomonas syringae pv. actinidiae]